MFKQLAFVVINLSCCFGLAAYHQFPGFDVSVSESVESTITENSNVGISPINQTSNEATTQKFNTTQNPFNNATTTRFVCPEDEQPSNIGAYEVPTQRDIALLTRTTLQRMFGSYHQKALYFLEDIKKATRGTADVEHKCEGNKYAYRKCVKHVSNQCEMITKSLVISLERQRHDVAAFSEKSLCSLEAMKADPVKLIKVLAMEEASLEFALPAFLRLLSACSKYCVRTFSSHKKPLRHLTDTDLVVKDFLSRKVYHQVL